MFRFHYLAGILYLAVCAIAVAEGRRRAGPNHSYAEAPIMPGSSGSQWFTTIKPFCNTLEVEMAVSQKPPPADVEGFGYGAACFALGGKIYRARALLLEVAPAERWRAAGLVFDVAHPIADAGDDRSAGPIMALVVEFWPNHYMALYHAGAAAFGLGEKATAKRHLQAFLATYTADDGWRKAANKMLETLGSP